MLQTPRGRFITFAVLTYVVLALAWIYLSDRLLLLIVDDAAMVQLSTIKGGLFVLITAVLFFMALRAVPDNRATPTPLLGSLLASPPQMMVPLWLRYGAAIVLAVAMLLFRQALDLHSADHPLMILFMLPVILSALLGGLGPGLLATATVAIGVDWLSSPPIHTGQLPPFVQLQWIFLVINGLAVSVLTALLHHSLQAFRRQGQLLDAVVSGTNDAIFVKDSQGRYLLANEAAASFVGRPVSELLGSEDSALFEPASAQRLQTLDQGVMQAGVVQNHVEQLTTADGRELTFMVTKGPVLNGRGQVAGLFGISRDITIQSQQQQALERSRSELLEAQRLARVGSWEWDLRSDRHTWSEQIYHIYGRDPALPPAVYPEVCQYFTAQSWQLLTAAVERCRQQAESYQCEAEVLRADGTQCWILARGEPRQDATGQVVALHGTVQDITAERQLRQQLQASEARLQRMMDATSDGFWEWDCATGKVYRSPRYYDVTGYPAELDNGDFNFFQRMIHPMDRERVAALIAEHLAGASEAIAFECCIFTHNNELRWLQVKGRIIERDTAGQPRRLAGSVADISERKRADDDLRVVLNVSCDAIWVSDDAGRLLFANPAACHLTGYSEQETLALTVAELISPKERETLAPLRAELERSLFIRREWQLLRKDGVEIPVELTTGRMPDGRYMAFGRDLSAQRAAAATLQEREQQLARVIEGSDQGYWDWNLQTNEFQVSPRWESMLGYAPGELDVRTEHWPELVHPDDLKVAMRSIERHLHGEQPLHEVELRCRGKNGDWCWVLSRGRIVAWDEQGRPLMMSGTHTDISERKILEQAQQEAAVVFDSSYEGIMVVSPDRRIAKVNSAFTRITGFEAAEVIDKSPSVLASGRHDAAFYQQLWHSLAEQDFWRGEIWNRRKSGEEYPELLSISVVRDGSGNILHYVGIFSDISQLKAHEAELDRVAHYDALTGVPNRRLLSERLEQTLFESERHGRSCAVCMLDLDGFKQINDNYGHAVGDQVLVMVTEQLKSVLRARDTLARLGGDEFVLLLAELGSISDGTQVIERLMTVIQQPLRCHNQLLSVTASVGVSFYPQDNADPDTLLRHADQAMYQAKEAGKNRYQLFDPDHDRQAQDYRRQQERMLQALEAGEFVLFYQPKVDLRDGRLIGVEALIRWQHPERGLLPPIEFLPYLHASVLEVRFGDWVIATALQQASVWLSAGERIPISVNISARHLLTDTFYEQLLQAIAGYPEVAAELLELEVLESAALADIEQAARVMQQCRRQGFKFALDDFGTGYSSLTYLRKLPINTLKIDQSFVRDMLTDPDDLGIVEGVIRLASVFQHQVIAEGVETWEHGVRLRQLGCHLAQGYGIARPMPAAELLLWLEQWRRLRPWEVNLLDNYEV